MTNCKQCGNPFQRTQRGLKYYCTKVCQKAAKAERGRQARRQFYRNSTLEQRHLANRKLHLKHTFNLSPRDYDAILARQGGGCGICGGDKGAKTYFSVDHDHITGFIRGLLCHRCNMGLGSFRDNPKTLSRAISYLGVSFGNQYLKQAA